MFRFELVLVNIIECKKLFPVGRCFLILGCKKVFLYLQALYSIFVFVLVNLEYEDKNHALRKV